MSHSDQGNPHLADDPRTLRPAQEQSQAIAQNDRKLDSPNFTPRLADSTSKVGGGALPLLVIPTCVLALVPGRLSANTMEQKLRDYDPPIISRVEKDQVLLDVRTVQESELKTLAGAIKKDRSPLAFPGGLSGRHGNRNKGKKL